MAVANGHGRDDGLDGLLAAESARFDVDGLRALVDGVAAAPAPAVDGDGWMRLVADAPSQALRDRLREMLAVARARAEGGLSAGKAASSQRVASLRAELARRGLDGFVVPHADAHQGEFVPPHARRLAWLIGFTGSAGVAVVLRERAAIFVDGRYTLQVREEVDTGLFTPCHITDQPPAEWIAGNLGEGAKLGYDPWLHTPDGRDRLRSAAAQAGAELVAVDGNPIDAVWPNQPAAPIAPVVPHEASYAGRAAADKRVEIAEILDGHGADAAVLTLPDSIAWLLNIRGGDVAHTPLALSFAIIHADRRVDWFIDSRKLTSEMHDWLGEGVRVRRPDELAPTLDALAGEGRRVMADPATAPVWVFDRLERAGAEAVSGADPVQRPKACKNATELEGSRAAHRRDGAAMTRFLAWLSREAPARAARGEPVTEIEAAEALAALRRGGELFRDLSFETISAAGPHGALPHYRVGEDSNRGLGAGELYLVDSGGQYLDGTTDITRVVVVGTPTPEMRAHYTRVLKGHIALATARFPRGTTGSQLDTLARAPLWQAGLDYDHGTGHGVGSYLGVHEGPQRISKLPNRVALAPGMICSNEPGYYREGAYGIRIENLVAVGEDTVGASDEREMLALETLTLAPFCRALIDPNLLSAEEIAWIDAYHARVAETLTPLLDAETAAWLKAETAPLGKQAG